ncbi:MAG: hypothetical protein AB9866_10910 [Syntrophobacteraceae bacterium]
MGNLADYQIAIDALVPGVNLPLGEVEKNVAINNALRLHSKYKPRKIPEDLPGDGGFDYPVSGLALWINDFSIILQVEYPVNDLVVEDNILEESDWQLYEKPAGSVLRFLSDVPQATENMRITYTTTHVFSLDDVATVADVDEGAVQALAASFYCRQIAAAYAQSQDSTIQADSVDHSSKRREYEAQAVRYRSEYDEHMGINKSGPKGASVTGEWDTDYPGGYDRLTHPRRNR